MNDQLENSGGNKPLRDERGRILPGFSGNPSGRPQGTLSVTQEIKTKLQEIPEGYKQTYLELMVNNMLSRAVEGDVSIIKEIWHYIDGLPVDRKEVQGNRNLLFRVVYQDDDPEKNNNDNYYLNQENEQSNF